MTPIAREITTLDDLCHHTHDLAQAYYTLAKCCQSPEAQRRMLGLAAHIVTAADLVGEWSNQLLAQMEAQS